MSNTNALTKPLLDIAVESWRFCRKFENLLDKIADNEQARHHSHLLWFESEVEKSMEEAGFRFVNLEGHSFDVGMAATPVNIEDFGPQAKLIVHQMLEPIIMGKEGIARAGSVKLCEVKS